VAWLATLALQATSALATALAHGVHAVFGLLPNLYDVYVAIPLRIEQAVRGEAPAVPVRRSKAATVDSRGMA